MHINKLYIEDFCGYSYSEIDFNQFNTALIVARINGSEKLSNTAGKSTIFNAIKYVLFNQIDFSLAENIIRKQKDICKVSIELKSSVDEQTYKIVRSRHRKTGGEVLLYKWVNDVWESATGRTNTHTEREIEKIIKLNYKTFNNSIYFGQNELSGLASLTSGKRKEVLRDVLQLDIYGKYEAAAKKKATEILKEIEKIDTLLSILGTPEQDIINLNKDLDLSNTDISNKNDILEKLKISYSLDNDKYTKISKEIESLETQVSDFNLKQKSIQNDILKLTHSITEYDKKILNIKTSGSNLNSDIKTINSQLIKLNDLKSRNPQEIKVNIEAITKEIIEKKSFLGTYSSKLSELKIPIPADGKCKHCRKTITREDRENCQLSIDNEIKDLNIKIENIQKDINVYGLKLKELNEELKLVENNNADILNKTKDLEIKKKEVENKKSVFVEFNELNEKLKKDLKIRNNDLDELNKNKLEDITDKFNYLKKDKDVLRNKISTIVKDVEDITKTINTINNNKAIILHKIEQRIIDVEKIKDHRLDIDTKRKKYSICNKAIQAFGGKGIPALITHSILDELQLETNLVLSKLRPDTQVQFIIEKEKSDGDLGDTLEIIFKLNGDDFEFLQLSGAQKVMVSLAMRLGLAEVIKKKLGIKINLLLIDEVEQSFDEDSVETFRSIIRKLSEEYKMLVISHNPSIKDCFKKAILVEKNNNISTAKLTDNW